MHDPHRVRVPRRERSLAGTVGAPLALFLLLVFASNPVATITAVIGTIFAVRGIGRGLDALARHLDGHARSLHIPRLGTVDYRFTNR